MHKEAEAHGCQREQPYKEEQEPLCLSGSQRRGRRRSGGGVRDDTGEVSREQVTKGLMHSVLECDFFQSGRESFRHVKQRSGMVRYGFQVRCGFLHHSRLQELRARCRA